MNCISFIHSVRTQIFQKSPVDKMSAEAAIDALRGELPFLWSVVGPSAPVTDNLEGNIIVKSNDDDGGDSIHQKLPTSQS